MTLDSYLNELYYEPDGSMRRWWKEQLLREGMSEAAIEQIERDKKLELEILRRTGQIREKSPSELAQARSGLTVEELLSEGYIDLDDLTSVD